MKSRAHLKKRAKIVQFLVSLEIKLTCSWAEHTAERERKKRNEKKVEMLPIKFCRLEV